MIKLIYKSPTVMQIKTDDATLKSLRTLLSYKNSSAQFEYDRLKKQKWMVNKLGAEAYNKTLAAAKKKIDKCLVFDSPEGPWTYTGVAAKIEEAFPGLVVIENNLEYPEAKLLPWHIPMKNKLRYYQIEAVKRLIEAKHGAVAMATGSGKSSCITQCVKELGLKTVIMCPSISIAEQLYDNLKINFGKKKVGRFDASHKESDKQIIVAVAQSLTRVEPESEHWEELSKTQVFIADESHQTPAETFNKVCFGVFANVPYRLFFSATQIRGDGQKVLLDGIIGPVVYEYSIEQAISDGYLVPMHFKMVRVNKASAHMPEDPNENTRLHLYYNKNVTQKAADIANNAVSVLGRKVLILIDEIEQFWHISGKLQHDYMFAHGGNLNAKQKEMVPEQWHAPDNNRLVEEYNAGGASIMIGTSAVSTGTDIRAADFIIYLQGGKSEVQVKQSIGRGTRLFPGKHNCIVVDFDVFDCSVTHRHALERKKFYEQSGKFEYVEM